MFFNHYRGTKSLPLDRAHASTKYAVLNFVRDPIDLIASAYLYHKQAPKVEKWAHLPLDLPLSATPKAARSQTESGRVRVAKAAESGLLAPYVGKETYAQYLNRTDEVNGVKAELHRARDDLHNIFNAATDAAATNATAADPRVRTMNVCLEAFSARSEEALREYWREILRFAGRGDAAPAVVAALAEKQPIIMGASHQTSHGEERARVKALAAEHDDGLLRDIAGLLPAECRAA